MANTLTSTATPKLPVTQEAIPSEIGGGPSESDSQSTLESVANAAAADSNVLQSEISQGVIAIVEKLQAAGIFPEKAQGEYLQSVVPVSEALTKALSESIVKVKAATTQGILLSQQLAAETITQKQFDAALSEIVVPSDKLLSSISGEIVGGVQTALQSLLNSAQLKLLAKLNTTKPGTTPTAATKINAAAGLDDGVTVKTPEDIPHIGSDDNTPDAQTLLPVVFDDTLLEKLKNGVPVTEPIKLTTPFEDIPEGVPVFSIDLDKGPKELPFSDPVTGVETIAKMVVADEKVLGFLEAMIANAAKIAEQNAKASAASLISLRKQPRIMTGARAVLRVNNKVVALCNNVSYEISMDWSEIRGIDELLPNDLAPMAFSVKGSMSIYRIPNQSPISDFIHQDMFRGMIWPYSTIEIRDKRTDELIMLVKRAAITSRAESFAKNQLTSTSMSFVGIGFRDEAIPELLPDKLTGEDDAGNGLLDAFSAITTKVKNIF